MDSKHIDAHSCLGCPMASGSVRGYDVVPSGEALRKVLEEIFTDAFMQRNTNFDNFEAFRYSSAVIINWQSDTLIYAHERLDAFVAESTRFSTWEDMIKTATEERYCAQ